MVGREVKVRCLALIPRVLGSGRGLKAGGPGLSTQGRCHVSFREGEGLGGRHGKMQKGTRL